MLNSWRCTKDRELGFSVLRILVVEHFRENQALNIGDYTGVIIPPKKSKGYLLLGALKSGCRHRGLGCRLGGERRFGLRFQMVVRCFIV